MGVGIITANFRAIDVDIAPEYPELVFGANAPNIIQWSSDGAGVKGSITDGVITFNNLYPDANGFFSFDLSIFARAKMAASPNGADFDLHNEPALATVTSITVEVTPTMTIFYDDNSSEAETGDTYYFVPGHRQSYNIKKASFFEEAVTEAYTEDDMPSRCMLATDNIMLFPGYPMDVSLFHYQFNGVIGQPYKLLRIFNETLIDFIDIFEGVEHEILRTKLYDWTHPTIKIQISETGNQYRVVYPLKCHYRNTEGLFVRWMNSFGGWSYWVFEGGCVTSYDIKNNGVASIFTPDPFQRETIKTLPRQSQRTIDVSTSGIECWMFQHLLDLQTSRNVYIWNAAKGDPNPARPWQPVEVASFTWNPPNGKVKEVFVSLRPQPDYTPQI